MYMPLDSSILILLTLYLIAEKEPNLSNGFMERIGQAPTFGEKKLSFYLCVSITLM